MEQSAFKANIRFMEIDLFLNELSAKPLFDDKHLANVKMMEFAKAAKFARGKAIKRIRSNSYTNEIELAHNYSMHDWLFDREFSAENHSFREFLQSMITPPYIDDDREDDYISSDFIFEDVENAVPKQKCAGLAAAYLYDSLAISFRNGPAWEKNELTLLVDNVGKTVLNVYSCDCLLNAKITSWIEKSRDIHLVETDILPCNKTAHYSDHHGKDKLEQFWKRLVNSPYVISARSTNWGGNKFIRKLEKDGMIEIVLVDTSLRYALQVKTTGRNFHETKCIAKILEEAYG